MKRIHGITAVLALCAAATAMGQNLIANPGFESQGSNWTLWFQGGTVAAGTVTYPNTGAHSGSRFAQIDITSPAASAGENWHAQFQPASWTAALGATYELKFWGKSNNGSNIHVSVQGPDYTYLTGTSFGLASEWTEYTLTHTAEAEGNGAVRFHIYVGESVDVYSFDDVSVMALPTSIQPGTAKGGALEVRQGRGHLLVSLGKGVAGEWNAELFDLRGTALGSATGRGEASVKLDLPKKSGAYIVRAKAGTHAWVRKVEVK